MWKHTDCGQDGESEEAGLDVVPVVGEVLAHDVHASRGGLTAYLLVPVQSLGEILHTQTWCFVLIKLSFITSLKAVTLSPGSRSDDEL